MSRLILAFRSFFAILFSGQLPADIAQDLGLSPKKASPPPKPTPPPRVAQPSDGALQILGILQRDSRFIDFLMEDIRSYSDDQVGAAVRELHDQCRDAVYAVRNGMIEAVWLDPFHNYMAIVFTKASGDDEDFVLIGSIGDGSGTSGA